MTNPIHLLDKKVPLYQPENGYKTNQDAVLLAAACPAKDNEHVLDMGCGVGGALYCLLYREPNLVMSGIDIEPSVLALAKDNAELNNKTVTFIENDVAHYRVIDPKKRFDHIISNPPYYDAGHHTPSPEAHVAVARGYSNLEKSLKSWVTAACGNLKNYGSLTLIYPAEKIDKVLDALGNKFGAKEIIPVYSKPHEPAKRVIVRSYKDRKSPCIIHPGVALKDHNLSPTKDADLLLRKGVSFDTVLTGERI